MSVILNGGILDVQFVACAKLIMRGATSDGMFGTTGGTVTVEPFEAFIRRDVTHEGDNAERKLEKAQYTVVVKKGVTLNHGDIIRRDSDGATFRITAGTADSEAPEVSTVPIAKASAEEWEVAE